MYNGITYFCIRDLWQLHFGGSSKPPLRMFSWHLAICRRQFFTSRGVFHEGNPRDWRDRLAVDDTWTVTVHVDLGTEGR